MLWISWQPRSMLNSVLVKEKGCRPKEEKSRGGDGVKEEEEEEELCRSVGDAVDLNVAPNMKI